MCVYSRGECERTKTTTRAGWSNHVTRVMALVVGDCSQGSPITHLEDCSQVSGNTVTPTHAETQCTHRQRPGERPGMGLAALDGTAAPPMSRVATARSRRRRAR